MAKIERVWGEADVKGACPCWLRVGNFLLPEKGETLEELRRLAVSGERSAGPAAGEMISILLCSPEGELLKTYLFSGVWRLEGPEGLQFVEGVGS